MLAYTHLTWLDLAVICVPLAIVLAVSFYMKRYMHSVADFLAANRCAGRYLISTAYGETNSNVMALIMTLELFSRVGFSMRVWDTIAYFIPFFFGLMGLVVYRMRQTRALTFHQFFELRYSKGIRIFASILNVFSGLFYFGVQPALGARFFVYFCGLPTTLTFAGWSFPTYVPVMLVLMGMALNFALTGGQISVMVTDCLEGVISSIFYLVVAFFLVYTISISEARGALLAGPPGGSFVDPFDIGSREDFNGWYIILALGLQLYYYRGNSLMGFVAAAKTAHEGRMAGILGHWRQFGGAAMTVLVSIAAFTLLHHPDFAAQQAQVDESLKTIGSNQLAIQMRMPMALGVLLAPGVKGAFCAVLLFGLLASQGAQLHSFGSTFLQDVILPLRKKPFEPKAHVRALRGTIFGVAAFVCTFSILYKPVDYLVLIIALIGAIYLGGVGLVVWGGLYWKKGTTAGAWTSLSLGAGLAVSFNLIQQFWTSLNPVLAAWSGPGLIGSYLAAHAAKFPLNGVQLSALTALIAGTGYIVVSLLTCKEDFNLDAMLHRGKYRIASEDIQVAAPEKRPSWLHRVLEIDEHFTRSDRFLTITSLCWTSFWFLAAVGIVIWTLVVGRLSENWFFNYAMIAGVGQALVLGVITTVWFGIGVTHDLLDLFRTLKTAKRVDSDDGTVRNHHNLGEPRETPTKVDPVSKV